MKCLLNLDDWTPVMINDRDLVMLHNNQTGDVALVQLPTSHKLSRVSVDGHRANVTFKPTKPKIAHIIERAPQGAAAQAIVAYLRRAKYTVLYIGPLVPEPLESFELTGAFVRLALRAICGEFNNHCSLEVR